MDSSGMNCSILEILLHNIYTVDSVSYLVAGSSDSLT